LIFERAACFDSIRWMTPSQVDSDDGCESGIAVSGRADRIEAQVARPSQRTTLRYFRW